jgi:hypothetical protein
MDRKLDILPFFATPTDMHSPSLLNKVIETSYRIAIKYLQAHRLNISKLINKEDLTLQELAMDCIVGLFVREPDNEIISIQHTFNNWKPVVKTEEDCLFFLNKVVSNRVEQHIYKLFKEEDPFFSRLLDSVNYLVRTNGFNKIHFLGKTFLTESLEDKFEKNFIPTDEFEKIPAVLFQNKKTLLGDLFSYLRNETGFNPAIPLNELINRLKHINFSEYLVNEFVISEYKKIEINQIVEVGLNYAIEKLLTSYFDKGKLDEVERIAFELALKEMVIDLSDGGINPGLYKYLSPYLVGLTEQDYQIKYHNILEYLLKVMKSKIADTLMEKD